jgi:hypothetical protein
MHSASAEEEASLALVDDFVSEINHAVDTLEGWTPDTVVANYRAWSSKHLRHAVDGFAFLRRSGRLKPSKFLVRPAIEMALRLQATRLQPDLFYRIAHEEHRQDKRLLRIGGDDPKLQAESDRNWEGFKNAFKKEFPAVPIPDLCVRCDKLTIERVAGKALMKDYYDSHYRIYSRYTHGALHASTGNLDQATDRADNQIMAVCALVALDNLISLGAKSPNHDRLVERLEQLRT